jgi:Right handed beta helix region
MHKITPTGWIAKVLPLLEVQGAKSLGLALLLLSSPAAARTLEVGPGHEYAQPSAAAAVAQAGDTVSIAPGEYFDCAIWLPDGLTIAGAPGGSVTITDKACAGKAAFVIEGNGVTVRNLSFARIRVLDDNGAGIRADGRDLTVQDSRFDNTQLGIFAAGSGALHIIDCTFEAEGASMSGRINFAVRASGYDLLRIEHSSFEKARGGGHISAMTGRTELVGNRLLDEGGHMSGPMVTVNGGALLLEGNTVDLAAGAAKRPGVVLATGDATAIAVRDNTLREDGPDGVPLLRNWTGREVTEQGNTVPAGTEAVSDAGVTYHRLRATAAELRDNLRELLRLARHVAGKLVHG